VRLSASPRSSIKTSTLFFAMDILIHHGGPKYRHSLRASMIALLWGVHYENTRKRKPLAPPQFEQPRRAPDRLAWHNTGMDIVGVVIVILDPSAF
jgi:hypothetical protein